MADHVKFREALDRAMKAVTLAEAKYFLKLAISHMDEDPAIKAANRQIIDEMLKRK